MPLLMAVALLLAGALPAGSSAASTKPGGGPFEINVTHGLGAGEPELAIDPVHHTLVMPDTEQVDGLALEVDASVKAFSEFDLARRPLWVLQGLQVT